MILFLVAVGVLAAGLIAYLVATSETEGLRAGFNPEFMARPDGYKGVSKAYGFAFVSAPIQLAAGKMHQACKDGDVDVISAFATDGPIDAYDLLVLEDDKGFFPPYDAAPIVRAEVLNQHPELGAILDKLAGNISLAEMRSMNLEVVREQSPRKPEDVAHDFLVRKGLLDSAPVDADPSAGHVSVANKNFTEQRILGSMLAELIRHHSNLEVELIRELASDRIIGALQSGEIDLYVEYTGTGLMNVLKREPMSGAQRVYDLVKEEFRKRYNLLWMKPLGFSNSYTLTMRRSKAEKLGIRTISDLAEYVRKQNRSKARAPSPAGFHAE